MNLSFLKAEGFLSIILVIDPNVFSPDCFGTSCEGSSCEAHSRFVVSLTCVMHIILLGLARGSFVIPQHIRAPPRLWRAGSPVRARNLAYRKRGSVRAVGLGLQI